MANNFLVFDAAKANILNDSDYNASTERQNGVVDGIANPALHNKIFHQLSVMAYAWGQVISDYGFNASDASESDLVTAIKNMLKKLGGETGDVQASIKSAKEGWVLAVGTIGNASSNATTRANADCQALFELTWNQISNANAPLFDAAGATVARGVSANADWLANRRISVVDFRGRALIGCDTMNGQAAARVASNASSDSFTASAIGSAGGKSTHTQTLIELVSHRHSLNAILGNHSGGGGLNYTPTDEVNTTQYTGYGGGADAKVPNSPNQPMNIMQPSLAVNIFIKL